jgi:UDP-2,3-diacylglucosamine pyrophosphatase LpxH
MAIQQKLFSLLSYAGGPRNHEVYYQWYRVVYITGNHDEMMRKYTDLNMGHFTLTDKLVLEIDQKMTWIFHGDVFDNTTKGSARIRE